MLFSLPRTHMGGGCNPHAIRRADKFPVFVILDKEEYLTKLNAILSDSSKSQKIKEDPTKKLKARVNRDIKSANALIGGVHFQPFLENSPLGTCTAL